MSEYVFKTDNPIKTCSECDYRCGLNIIARKDQDGRHENCPLVELPNSPWHTGTPEEEGWYVIQTNGSNHIGGNLMVVEKTDNGLWFDDSNLYCRVDSESIIAYQKIEPYKESEE